MVRQNLTEKSADIMSSADTTIEEAHHLTRKLIEHERGKVGGRVEMALYRASQTWGIEEGQLRTLWHRWRSLKFVKAHVLDRLRQIDAVLEEKARRERQILAETAETLERHKHPAAGIARYAAEMAREEAE